MEIVRRDNFKDFDRIQYEKLMIFLVRDFGEILTAEICDCPTKFSICVEKQNYNRIESHNTGVLDLILNRLQTPLVFQFHKTFYGYNIVDVLQLYDI